MSSSSSPSSSSPSPTPSPFPFDFRLSPSSIEILGVREEIHKSTEDAQMVRGEGISGDFRAFQLDISSHSNFLLRALEMLPSGYSSLDSSRPWLVYWALQSLYILKKSVSESTGNRCVDFLISCWVKSSGGFSGGPLQTAHLATTFAAVGALVVLTGISEKLKNRIYSLLEEIRIPLRNFVLKLKNSNGSFAMCEDGESDTRAAYCALCVTTMVNVMDDKVTEGLGDWLRLCQTYEGGIGSSPLNESHGGYTFTAFAASILLGDVDGKIFDRKEILKWAERRIHSVEDEGGLNGRANKLVDGCYSYWVGAVFALFDFVGMANSTGIFPSVPSATLYDSTGILHFVTACCQSKWGGLRDKPGKHPDLYHSCYGLAGMAIALAAAPPKWADKWEINTDINAIFNLPNDLCRETLKHFQTFQKNRNDRINDKEMEK